MNAVPELAGVDLARQALLTAREAAKKNSARTTKPSGAPSLPYGGTGASHSGWARQSR
ncbi:hypothetical protein ACFT25_16300 [Streptomyces hydrogenans]|uniref:hypothetical protein n=1 Tax=Streptomyces hydrogenans TaxID=1873719 RepID=UPI00363C2E84